MRRAGHFSVVLLFAALAGCTQFVWQHPVLQAPEAGAVRRECRAYAEREALHASLYDDRFEDWRPNWYYDRWGRLKRRSYAESQSRRWQIENRLYDECLRTNGFRLVPVP